jgi:hypothetical protein
MKNVIAVFGYLFLAGLVLGPLIGEKIRCGEDVKISTVLTMAIAFPVALGAAITSGKLPVTADCKALGE